MRRSADASAGAVDKTIAAPFGEVPGETFATFVALDGLVHGWDLATATGQDHDPPAALVAEAEPFARGALDPLRDGDAFADATQAPTGASPIEQLAAYTAGPSDDCHRRPRAAKQEQQVDGSAAAPAVIGTTLQAVGETPCEAVDAFRNCYGPMVEAFE